MNNIVLIGYMGTGKSSIGKALSYKLNMNFCDTDELIEKKTKMEIKDVFDKYGEEYFRDIETSIVKEVYTYNNYVIATGGGVVLRKTNIELLRENSLIVCLYGDVEYIYNNIMKSTAKRPLLKERENLKQNINKMLKIRKEYYNNNDFSVNVSNDTIEQGVDRIIDIIKNEGYYIFG